MILGLLFLVSFVSCRTVTFTIDDPNYVASSHLDIGFVNLAKHATTAEISRLQNTFVQHYANYTGFDVTQMSTSQYVVIPVNIGTVVSYGAGIIKSDTDFGRSREKDNWYTQFGGYYMSLKTSGTFPGGILFNTTFAAGDSMLIGYYPFLEINGTWTSEVSKENHFCFTPAPGKIIPNGFKLRELYGRFVCVDENNVPTGSIQETAFYYPTSAGKVAQFKRGVYTSPFVV